MRYNQRDKVKLSEETRRHLTGYAFVLPAFLYMLVLIGYPIIYNFVISLQDISAFNLAAGKTRPFVDLQNYISVFMDPTMLIALKNTLFYTVACLIIQFTFGLLYALLFIKKFPLAKILRGLLIIGWIMPMTVTALLFKYMLSPDVGIINQFMLSIGMIKQPIGWLLNQKTAIWGPIFANCWVGIPFNMLLLSTGLAGISEDVYESAGIDGAGQLEKFWYITLPLLRPAMLSVLVLGFVYTFKVFDLIFVMTGGGPVNATEVLATYSYRLSFSNFYFGKGAAAANVLFLILFGIALIYLRLIKKEEAM